MGKLVQKAKVMKSTKQVSNAEAKAAMREFVKTELLPSRKQPRPPALPNLAENVIQKITEQEKEN